MRGLRVALLVAVAVAAALAPRLATAASVSLTADSASIHVGMPFTLTLSATGFEEEPTPAAPELAIEGCEVTYLGMDPAVSTHITIINGRTTEEREVTFRYQWRVLARAAGTYRVPSLEIEQAGVAARTGAASFEATVVPDTPDMAVRMQLPERAVYVGETFDASVEWLLARSAEWFEFRVPLFEIEGVEVEAGPGAGRTVAFTAGASEVKLPMVRTEETVQGRTFTRFRFPARITLAGTGPYSLDPIRVLARLRTGETRDRFGNRRPQQKLYRAEGGARHLVVRPLPVAGRPASFVNAIGAGFSIDVRASRTVVAVGDPVELTVHVRGDAPLVGLSLPPLDGPGGLPAEHFSVAEGSVAGRIDAQTNRKTFAVTVRVTSPEAREIPPIAFSWFDPEAGEYRTARSRPIALAVEASEVVGADDVIAGPSSREPAGTSPDESPAGAGRPAIATLVGADMSLSEPGATLARPWGTGGGHTALAALYGGPVVLLFAAWWRARTAVRRTRRRAVRAALRTLEEVLAGGGPARDAAPAIVAAMRRLAELTGADRTGAAAALERLETRAFDPRAAERPVEPEVSEALRAVARGWAREERRSGASPSPAVLLAGVLAGAGAGALAAGAGGPAEARSAPASEEGLDAARVLYAQALGETTRDRRVRLFGAAERALRPIAEANPLAPGIQVDWGNAALGAQDAGRAVLAFRRALRAAPGDVRARANLAWVRGRMPSWVPRPAAAGGAFDSLFFWRGSLNPGQLHLAGAAAFAVGLLALAGGFAGGGRRLRILAAPALAVCAIAVVSGLASRPDPGAAVVVTDGATLRSADSPGAAPALGRKLPAGAEVTIVEDRARWARVRLADGATGWLATSAVKRVAPNPR